MFDSKVNGFNCSDGGDNPPPPKPKKCKMQHMLTGEIIEFDSQQDFVEKYDLDCGQVSKVINGKCNFTGNWFCPDNKWRPKIHRVISPEGKEYSFFESQSFCKEHGIPSGTTFTGLLRGEDYTCYGWKLVGGKEKKVAGQVSKFKIINPEGQIYEGDNVRTCIEKFNLNECHFRNLLRGKAVSCRGWRLVGGREKKPTGGVSISHCKDFKLISPDNKIYEGKNISRFSRQFNLTENNIGLVVKGVRKSHKGWTLYKENVCV
ncbi:MAG: hypothetical protein NTZ48_07600, partial [Candidatus Omnitrophica bacterium]|nr:hypothetical protein [Candidatus Omnitrophota bacterium]